MNTEQIIKDTCKYNSEDDGPEYKTVYCVNEVDPISHDSKILYMSYDADACRCYLLEHLQDIEPTGDFKRQVVVTSDDRFELYIRGFFYGKSLSKVYKINSFEY